MISVMVTLSIVVRHFAECSTATAAAIAQLDADIMKVVLNPQPEDGDKILTDIQKYVSLVNISNDRLILNEISKEDCETIHTEGSIDFLTAINSTLLNNLYIKFDWQAEKIKEFKYLIVAAEKLWLTFITGCFYTFGKFKNRDIVT